MGKSLYWLCENTRLSSQMKRIKQATFSVLTRLQATNLWQAAFVRPFNDPTNWRKGFGVLLAYSFGVVLVITGGPSLINDALSWPGPLETMHKTTGVIVSAGTKSTGSGGRGGGGGGIGYLVVSTPNNGEETFYGPRKVKVLLKHRVGQTVTIWWQPSFKFQLWKVGVIKKASEIYVKDVDWFVLKYSEDRPRQLAFDSKDHYWYWSMLGLGLFLLVRPAWKHRKPNGITTGISETAVPSI
jgi:hypothetical protein